VERIEAHRLSFANLIAATAGLPPGNPLVAALASIPREQFVGRPPWKILTPSGYIETTSDDPAFLYQDIVVSLGSEAPFNNGQPSLHAFCLAALALKEGERVVHVGAGTGYYTLVLAKLVGDTGLVDAYEIDPELGKRAVSNLASFPNIVVHLSSGTEGPLPACDVLYVNAGATEPLAVWLDALGPNGRLLFPMTASTGSGAMLFITKKTNETYAAQFLIQVQFVPCIGARIESTAQKLTDAFRKGEWNKVRSLYRNDLPDDTCWCSGPGWWLSTN
jgi:protein-L-isoaspartate(D-aspartate) O-methyltransferase